MFVRELIATPTPANFLGVSTGESLPFFIDSENSEDAYEDVICLGLRCDNIKPTDKGISIAGELYSPPEFMGNLALVDINWDREKYTGKIAIAGFYESDISK